MSSHVAVPPALDDLLAQLVRGETVDAGAEDVAALGHRAIAHGVEALVSARLRGQQDVAPALFEAFRDLEAAAGVASALQDRELRRVLDAIGRKGIEVLIVKGAALAHTDYPEPHLRPRVDTDLLVRRHDLEPLTALLATVGYRPSARISTGELVSHQRAFEFRDPRGMQHVLDVHWRLANPQVFAAELDELPLFETAVPVPALGAVARTTVLVERLLLCTIHRLAHHQGRERLIWLHDMDLLARRASADDWKEVVRLASVRRMRAVCLSGLLRAQEAFGTPLPEGDVRSLRVPGESEPSAVWVRSQQRPLDVLQADLRVLPSWRLRLRLLREHAFPPPAFVLDRYRVHRRAWLPALYAHRLMTGLWKWLIAR